MSLHQPVLTEMRRMVAAQIYGYKFKYLEGCLTTWPLGNISKLPLESMTSPDLGFGDIWSNSDEFSPIEQDLN